MNPYDNNPFKTDEKEIENEFDANRELAKRKARRITDQVLTDLHIITDTYSRHLTGGKG
jgi:hypothetical protein